MHIRSSCQIRITKEKVEQYAELSGDTNAIHLDVGEAKRNQFHKPVAHGLLVMGLGMEIVLSMVDENMYVSEYEMKFLQPVYVGEKIDMVVEGKEGNGLLFIKGLVNEHMVVKGKLRLTKTELVYRM